MTSRVPGHTPGRATSVVAEAGEGGPCVRRIGGYQPGSMILVSQGHHGSKSPVLGRFERLTDRLDVVDERKKTNEIFKVPALPPALL